MTYRGTVKDGVIVLDAGARLTEGTVVEVREAQTAAPAPPDVARSQNTEAEGPTWAEKWKVFIGTCQGLPSDLAENHDHYIHGTEKGIDRK
jgi:hypothetical protein